MRKPSILNPKARFLGVFVILFFLVLFQAWVGNSADLKETVDTKTEQEVYLFRGDLMALKVYSLTRLAISNPEVVDVTNADVNEVLIVGQRVGTTQIFIWDELGKRQVIASVLKEDLDLIVTRLQKLLKNVDIDGVIIDKNNYEGKVVLSGKIPTPKFGDFRVIVERFGDNVINLVKEEKIQDLIQIDVQFTELSTTLDKVMGIDWASGNSAIKLTYPETLPKLDGTPGDYFKIGDFKRTTSLTATINFLLKEGKARVLSKPSVLVTNGQAAALLVGGEVPIRTTTIGAAGNTSQDNVSFRSYGIDLTVTPEIQDDKIDLTLALSVRDIDAANSSAAGPAFTSRTATTKLFLNDGQTIVIAGLIKQNRSQAVNSIPFISKIPIVGLLFRNTSKPALDFDQELVITITPKIYKDEKAEEKKESSELEAAEIKEEKKPEKALAPVMKKVNLKTEAEEGMMPAEEKKSSVDSSDAVPPGVAQDKEPVVEKKENQAITKDAAKEPAGAQSAVVEKSLAEEEGPQETQKVAEPEQAEKMEAAAGVAKAQGKKGPAQSETADDHAMQEKAIAFYVQAVQKTIAQAISFPYEAREKSWEGTVTLTLTILSDGTLQDIEIKKSSGYNVFDNDAKNTAQILSPFDPFPSELDLEEVVVSLPIVYSQKTLTK